MHSLDFKRKKNKIDIDLTRLYDIDIFKNINIILHTAYSIFMKIVLLSLILFNSRPLNTFQSSLSNFNYFPLQDL